MSSVNFDCVVTTDVAVSVHEVLVSGTVKVNGVLLDTVGRDTVYNNGDTFNVYALAESSASVTNNGASTFICVCGMGWFTKLRKF